MALETLVVAVGPNDDSRTEELTTAILDIAGPVGASVEDGIDEAGFPDDNEPSPTELAARLEAIDTVAAELETADVSYEIRGAIGVEGETIIQETDAADGDLLFLSGRKRSPTGKAVFGSTAHRIMMNASCPVLFVREDIYSAENE